MMKITIFYLILLGILIYLAAAFILWQINASHWNEFTRALCVVIFLVTGSYLVAFRDLKL